MDRSGIEAYVRRDWASVAASHVSYWAERFQTEGWRPGWDAAQSLRAHVRLVRPDFPTDDDRRRDLEDHEAFRAILDRASHAFSGR